MKRIIRLFPILLLSGACEPKKTPAPATSPPVVTDILKPVDYIALGVPAPNREWSTIDYSNAIKVIAKLPLESLPRFGKSDGCFERMVSRDNLNFIFNHTLPVEQRLQSADGYIGGLTQLVKIYMMHPYQSHVLTGETLGLIEMNMYAMTSMFPLMNEFMASLPPEQRTPVRQAGKQKMIAGIEQMMAGCFTVLGEDTVWTPQQRRQFADNLEETVKRSWPELTVPFKKELHVRTKERLDAEADPDVKQALHRLKESLSTLESVAK